MSLKSLSTGSECPPLEPGKLRLYSMRFCPLSQRARLVLAAKKIPYEVVNVNLVKKPEWFLAKSPMGTVPVLEHDDGRTLYESLIVCDYLDSIYPDSQLTPTDPYTKAKHNLIVDAFARVTAAYYKVLRANTPESLNDLNKSYEYFEKTLTANFFGGDKAAMVDYMIWPWFERHVYLKNLLEYELDAVKFPNLAAWIARMKQLPAVKETKTNPEHLIEFHKSYTAGRPDYDVGLE